MIKLAPFPALDMFLRSDRLGINVEHSVVRSDMEDDHDDLLFCEQEKRPSVVNEDEIRDASGVEVGGKATEQADEQGSAVGTIELPMTDSA